MALSMLCSDVQGIVLGQLCNPLEPRLAMYFSSASSELRALLTQTMRQQLRADHEAMAALCRKMGMSSCKELREAWVVRWWNKGLSAAELATLGTLGSMLPALAHLTLGESSGSASPDGVQRLVAGLGAGALPAVTMLGLHMHVGDAGASALAAALGQGALPRLRSLLLTDAGLGDAALVALAPALRRRPALEKLGLYGNPFGDEGLAALVAPPPPAGTMPLLIGGLKKLKTLDLRYTQVSDAGYAALATALDSGALPALESLKLDGIPASVAAKEAVHAALARSTARAEATKLAAAALRSAINRNESGPLESALELAEACGLQGHVVWRSRVERAQRALNRLRQEAERLVNPGTRVRLVCSSCGTRCEVFIPKSPKPKRCIVRCPKCKAMNGPQLY